MASKSPQCPLEHYCPLNASKKLAIIEEFQVQHKKYKDIVKDKLVLNGPFKGMKYPFLSIYDTSFCPGSSVYPKLLGSYERELNDLIERLCQKTYSSILNIGCAEGYYAVGFSRRFPEAKVYAFDADEQAQEFCKELAQANGASIECGGFFNKSTLANLDLGKKALIICDCEGYETSIFDSDTIKSLNNHDLLIESHDCIHIEATQYLYGIFSKTHNITEIESVDDILKAYRYDYPELANLNLKEKKEFLSEHRGHIMRWLYMEPK